MGLYQEQRRHRDRLPAEDGRHHLAAAPFYFTFEIQQALAACEHVIDDDDSFSPDVSRNAVVPFQNALASLALVQALAGIRHIHIVKSGGQFRPVGRDVPVKSLETLPVLYPVAARHEHDVARGRIQRQGRHASLEKRNAVVLSLLEGIEGSAELSLFFAEQPFVPRRIVVSVERHADAVEAEGLERMPVLEKISALSASRAAANAASPAFRRQYPARQDKPTAMPASIRNNSLDSIWMILDGAETLLKFLHLGKQIVEPDMFSVYH